MDVVAATAGREPFAMDTAAGRGMKTILQMQTFDIAALERATLR